MARWITKGQWACCLLALPLSGCLAEVLVSTATQATAEAKQLQSMQKQIAHAQGTSAQIELTQAIKVYQGEKGVNPPSLDALVPEYLPKIPLKPDGTYFGYDPATGALLDRPLQSKGGQLSSADWTRLDTVRAAVQQYGTDTTWYPATLSDLVPKYLSAPPLTDDGRAFVYDNQTGEVFLPGQAPAAPAPSAAPAYGASPIGAETSTAIGISNQLDNMSTAGTSAAGSRGRDAAHNAGGNYSDRQMKAADELGL